MAGKPAFCEAAMVTSGAAAGLAIATAACLAGMDSDIVKQLPLPAHDRTEVIIRRCHRSGFDMAIRQAGAVLVEIGHADATGEQELEEAINARTAAIVYLAGTRYERGALPLDKVLAATGRHDACPPTYAIKKNMDGSGSIRAAYGSGMQLDSPPLIKRLDIP